MNDTEFHALLIFAKAYFEKYEGSVEGLKALSDADEIMRYLVEAGAELALPPEDILSKAEEMFVSFLLTPTNDFLVLMQDHPSCSVRMWNSLSAAAAIGKVPLLGDIVFSTESGISALRNMGPKSINELKDLLREKGLKIEMEVPESIRHAFIQEKAKMDAGN